MANGKQNEQEGVLEEEVSFAVLRVQREWYCYLFDDEKKRREEEREKEGGDFSRGWEERRRRDDDWEIRQGDRWPEL